MLSCFKSYSQNEEPFKNRKNAVEVSAYLTNFGHFKFTRYFTPEFGYSRYLGEYFKAGVFFSKFNHVTGVQSYNYMFRAGFLPLPLIIKNEEFNNLWEIDFSFNYVHKINKPEKNSPFPDNTIHRQVIFSSGLSRYIYNNFYLFGNFDIRNSGQIYLGLRYKF